MGNSLESHTENVNQVPQNLAREEETLTRLQQAMSLLPGSSTSQSWTRTLVPHSRLLLPQLAGALSISPRRRESQVPCSSSRELEL